MIKVWILCVTFHYLGGSYTTASYIQKNKEECFKEVKNYNPIGMNYSKEGVANAYCLEGYVEGGRDE